MKNVLKDNSVQALLGKIKKYCFENFSRYLYKKKSVQNADNKYILILDESVTNFHDLTIGKFCKQTVKTSKVSYK